jgi:hypothetical protein|tara:strand:+ start:763 stop:909 length:147 start_codon:yes stop_codon:yes gene_type:complete
VSRHGENSFVAQQIRDQIHAQQTGKSAEDLYVTGSVKRPQKEPSQDGN